MKSKYSEAPSEVETFLEGARHNLTLAIDSDAGRQGLMLTSLAQIEKALELLNPKGEQV